MDTEELVRQADTEKLVRQARDQSEHWTYRARGVVTSLIDTIERLEQRRNSDRRGSTQVPAPQWAQNLAAHLADKTAECDVLRRDRDHAHVERDDAVKAKKLADKKLKTAYYQLNEGVTSLHEAVRSFRREVDSHEKTKKKLRSKAPLGHADLVEERDELRQKLARATAHLQSAVQSRDFEVNETDEERVISDNLRDQLKMLRAHRDCLLKELGFK